MFLCYSWCELLSDEAALTYVLYKYNLLLKSKPEASTVIHVSKEATKGSKTPKHTDCVT